MLGQMAQIAGVRALFRIMQTVRRQRNSDTVELAVKVWAEGLGGSVTPEGVTEKSRLMPLSRIDGLCNWASISPQETHEYATTESTEPNRRRR